MLINDRNERNKRKQQKQDGVLKYLRYETWSTASILRQVLSLNSQQAIQQTLAMLERESLLRKATIGGTGQKAVVYGITAHGLAMSFSEDEEYESLPVFEPSKITLSRIPHHLDIQLARLSAQANGWQNWTRGERLGFEVDVRPDALAVSPRGKTVAVEVERTIKTRKRYQQVIANHLMKIKAGNWDEVLYLTPDGMANRLKKVFDSIDWIVIRGNRIPLEQKHRDVFSFQSISEFCKTEKAA